MNRLRSLINPLAVLLGISLPQLHFLSFLLPWFVGTMMLLTFSSSIPPQEHGSTFPLVRRSLAVSLLLIALFWGGTALFGWPKEVLLAAVLIALAPPANAAPTLTQILGGNPFLTLKVFIVGHAIACLTIPLALGWLTQSEIGLWSGAGQIFGTIQPIITIPLALALGLRAFYPELSEKIAARQHWSLWIWSGSVLITLSKASHDIRSMGVAELWNSGALPQMAAVSLGLCILLYTLGWWSSRKHHPIEGTQSMGQKNTLLVIWIGQLYAGPVAALAPVFYVIWQNIALSWLVSRSRKKKKQL